MNERIGRYRLLGKLAQGGMAEVFLAFQEGPDGFSKTVVIKRILPDLAADENFVRMFLNEARLAAHLNHPHVAAVFELGIDEIAHSHFMALEWVDGCTLKRVVQATAKRGELPPLGITARIMADACAGLDFAHNLRGADGQPLKLIHRDISPENILVSYSGIVKVVDFGIAKAAMSEGLTQTGQVKGKFAYMAPELHVGTPYDRRIDIWALGVTLYWLLSGRRPFKAENDSQLIQSIVRDPVPPLTGQGETFSALAKIAHLALQKEPDLRFASARAMQFALEEFLKRPELGRTDLGEFMGALFPEDRDPHRQLTRSLLSGQLFGIQSTPASTDVAIAPPAVETQASGRRPARIPLWIASVLSLIIGVGVTSAVLLRRTDTPSSGPPSSSPPPPSPQAPLPQDGIPQPPALPVEKAPAVTPPPASPSPQPAPAKHGYRRAAPAGPPGKLLVRVEPWADVYVDGDKIGTTPLEPVSLAPGKHRLRFVNDEMNATRQMNVEIKSDQTSVIKVQLE